MTDEALIEMLRDRFTEAYHGPREAGYNAMATFLSERGATSREEAYAWLDRLEVAGLLRFQAVDEPLSAAMLEAARYGDMPAQGSAEGYWVIGGEARR